MLYGKAARAGVYQVQDILRRLGAGPDAEGLEMARELLKFVPPHHYLFEPNGKLPIDLAQDAGIVDMLLHPQDRAYSVPEIMEFVAAAGLIFFGWSDNADYCADRFLSGEMLERVLALPDAEQWAVVENLALLNSRHDFFLRKPHSARFLIRFDTDDYLSYVPQVRSGVKLAGDANALVLTRATPQGTVVTPISRSEALMRVADRCVQVMGGTGVSTETIVEQAFREIRAFRIYDGPTEVHKWSLAKKIKRDWKTAQH